MQNEPTGVQGYTIRRDAALLCLHRLAEAEAFAIHLEYLAPVGQAIQQGRCHPFALKHLIPFAEREVARHEQTAALVAIGEHLEQQLGAGAAERKIAELVADQEIEPIELGKHAIDGVEGFAEQFCYVFSGTISAAVAWQEISGDLAAGATSYGTETPWDEEAS
jgi:hypothetical protein